MASATQQASAFRQALACLTGDLGTRRDHVFLYRITVKTSDGHEYGLRLSAGINAKDPPKSDVGRLKRRLKLQDNEIDVAGVLDNWGPDELRKYVAENLTFDDLNERPGG